MFSRNSAPSTGRLEGTRVSQVEYAQTSNCTYFPPTPKPRHATNEQSVTKLLAPPEAIPKIPCHTIVSTLNHKAQHKAHKDTQPGPLGGMHGDCDVRFSKTRNIYLPLGIV